MSDFAWIVKLEKQRLLGSNGISLNYIVSKDQMNNLEGDLAGNRLWVIIRENEDRCLMVLNITKVEQFLDGYYTGDYLIFCDPETSFKISNDYNALQQYTVTSLSVISHGIAPLDIEIAKHLSQSLLNNVVYKLAPPKKDVLSKIPWESNLEKPSALFRYALTRITMSFPLDQIWGARLKEPNLAFLNFSLALYNQWAPSTSQHQINYNKVIEDPVKQLSIDVNSTSDISNSRNKTISIDKTFYEIDPIKIHARRFISSTQSIIDLRSSLLKTEIAEKSHQDMLRDISGYLISVGIKPYQSNSIDLMFEHLNTIYICELKSTTNDNFSSQAATGAFQLACYENALKDDYKNLKSCLILSCLDETSGMDTALKALMRFGISNYLYKKDDNWPGKIKGLLD